jgi:histidyl-tRNA synthetase
VAVARALRKRGIACEIYEKPDRYGKQIRYADRRGIPYVWFPSETGDPAGSLGGEVKDIRSGVQIPASAETWLPQKRTSWQIQWNESAYQELLRNPAYTERKVKDADAG